MPALSRRLLLLLVSVITLVALGSVVAACGSSSNASSNSATPAATSTYASMVPASLKQAGVLKVGTEFPYPPMEYYQADGTTPTGLDVDLITAIAARLGLKVQWVNMNWDGLILALQSDRFDVIAASMGDFTDRQQKVNFVDYLSIGEGVLVRKADAASVTSIDGLAGKTVGAAKGTIAVPIVQKLSQKLVAQGLQPIKLLQFDNDSLALTALQSGRIFAHVIDMPSAAYESMTAGNGELYSMVLPNVDRLAGNPAVPYGFAFRKDDMPLGKAIQGALNQMIADGSYAKLLAKYSLSAGALKDATINGGKTASGA